MDLDLHYEHKQHTFDRFCKTTIKHEAYNAFRQIRNQKNRFVSLSELSEDASEQLAVYDFYPWEYTAFPVDGDVILIKDDRLAEALTALPQEFRDILLMYWFLQMADREIGEKLSLSRRTVNNRRQRAYELLKIIARISQGRKNDHRGIGKQADHSEYSQSGKFHNALIS